MFPCSVLSFSKSKSRRLEAVYSWFSKVEKTPMVYTQVLACTSSNVTKTLVIGTNMARILEKHYIHTLRVLRQSFQLVFNR